MESRKAPFTNEEVNNINDFQFVSGFHPFTCCSPEHITECKRQNPAFLPEGQTWDPKVNDGVLKASNDGLICPCGKYTQDWVHEFMTRPFTPPQMFVDMVKGDK